MTIKLVVDVKPTIQKFKQNLAGLKARMDKAQTAATNMAASMIEREGRADIAASGNFGARWTEGLHVEVEGAVGRMRISMQHEIPFAGIFEEGGTIYGQPLLWIGLSGTDAEGVSPGEYGDTLFSAKSKVGQPLLFSMADKRPKFFGIDSVTIPPKWHLREIELRVMQNFRRYYDDAFRSSGP